MKSWYALFGFLNFVLFDIYIIGSYFNKVKIDDLTYIKFIITIFGWMIIYYLADIRDKTNGRKTNKI